MLLTDKLVRAAFRDEAAFPAAPVYAMTTEPVFGKTVLSMSGAEHRANRAMVSAPLRRNEVQQYLPTVIEPVINELIDRFVQRGKTIWSTSSPTGTRCSSSVACSVFQSMTNPRFTAGHKQ